MLGPSNTDAPRANLAALHLLDGIVGILLPAEGYEAIALGPAGDVVPHDTGIPEQVEKERLRVKRTRRNYSEYEY